MNLLLDSWVGFIFSFEVTEQQEINHGRG